MKLKLNTLVLALLFLLTAGACGSGSGSGCKGSEDSSKSAEFENANTLDEEIIEISNKIPKVTEIPYLLEQTGAEFNLALVNPRAGLEGYLSQPDKAALNLGIYAADMGYLSSYNKTQECIEYFEACKRIADELGIMGSFDPEMVKRVEANIQYRDSLALILEEAISETSKYLNGNSQSKLGALMVAGSFIESLYIATGVVKMYPKNAFDDPKQRIQILTPLIQIVINQHPAVTEVAIMLKKVGQTESIANILKDLDAVEAGYKKMNMEEQIKSGNAKFTDQTLSEVTVLVEKLRSGIVN